MASRAYITVRVTSTRGATKVEYATKGRYVSFIAGGLTDTLNRQPILTTASLPAFWLAVLALVQADITASE